MSFFVYLFVLLVAASSVLFGLDWMQAPLQPPPRVQQSAAVMAPVQPQQTAATPSSITTNANPAPVPPATTGTQPAVAAEAPVVDLSTGSTQPSTLNAQESEPKQGPLCDVGACERAYRSFTATDCTYQPSWGARRLCTKGNPPRRPAAQNTAKEANAEARCNVSACESAYQSFDAATCTYQSYAGGRRACTK